ncbi:N-acetyltransferase [Oceanispirochaeta crateris]|jgi:RimJ/RimL family protein N-acetyltransferase|uniref:N-acetyltransferase n=1 Tax=Oceanispirochaeta crateris TaxID=2518645 RepID=A0A5C1QNA1_9SPIO|nr:GNAT family N-acetyltransferase [Oceanispirochaeta crateris]QEN08699.1 N-acetyltransferase [Oceanispirochaeta crateris]
MRVVIETDRLLLRNLKLSDMDDLCNVLCDHELMQHYPATFRRDQVRSWIEWNKKNYSDYGYGLWAVILKRNQIFLGDCGITMQNIEGEELPELGYHIRKDYCQHGYATEAAEACIRFGFQNLGLHALYAYTTKDNIPSIRVAEKNGMTFVKYFRKTVMGSEVEEVLFSLKNDFPFSK